MADVQFTNSNVMGDANDIFANFRLNNETSGRQAPSSSRFCPYPPVNTSPAAISECSLQGIAAAGVRPIPGNSKPRSSKQAVPDDLKDNKYYERRKRNNVAAKRSRDARKHREDEVQHRVNVLVADNQSFSARNQDLREELSSLQKIIAARRFQSQGVDPAESGQEFKGDVLSGLGVGGTPGAYPDASAMNQLMASTYPFGFQYAHPGMTNPFQSMAGFGFGFPGTSSAGFGPSCFAGFAGAGFNNHSLGNGDSAFMKQENFKVGETRG